ncbi:hypothetical protein QUF80_05780 [Desulfococcaceae bacterium HSG8]|nr:hypothetical protein [Desulfococcaceae bacterium HSG8]
MINFRQEELIDELINQIREKYPETELVGITQSPEDPESLWIRVTAPEDEDRKIELREFGNEKAADILLDYGYHMLVMPSRKKAA